MYDQPESPDHIVGIEREIVEKFLILIKNRYPLVDKANYLLETLGTSGINIAMANQRDFLSHLCTVLTDSSLDYQGKLDQLATAEEHLRRAILECYQKAVTLKMKNVFTLKETYKREVIPLLNPNPIHHLLTSAPNISAIRANIDEIDKLRTQGRAAKARNKWDDKWEDGVRALLDAFKEAKELERTLEDYLLRVSQIKTSKTQIRLGWWGILATIIAFIFGLILENITGIFSWFWRLIAASGVR